MVAFLQGPHGSPPSHRTFRFRQQSQALRSTFVVLMSPFAVLFDGGDDDRYVSGTMASTAPTNTRPMMLDPFCRVEGLDLRSLARHVLVSVSSKVNYVAQAPE